MQKSNQIWEKHLEELAVKKKEAEEESRTKKEKLTDVMAERTLPEVKTSIKAATYAEAVTVAGRIAEDVKIDAKLVEDHFYSDASLTGVPAEHKDVLVASVGRLLQAQIEMVMQAVDQKIKQAAGPVIEQMPRVESSDDEEEELMEDFSPADGDKFKFQTGTEKKEKQRKKKEARRLAAATAARAANASTRMPVDQEQRKPSEKRTAEEQGGREPDLAEVENGKAATQQPK